MEKVTSKEDMLLRELEELVDNIQDKTVKSDIKSVFDKAWYMVMLRCNDLNPSTAFNSLNVIQHAVRHKHADWFRKFQPETLRALIESDAVKILKDKDAHGNCVILIRINAWNVKLNSFEDLVIAAIIVGIEILQVDSDMQTHGCVIIVDVKGMSFAQVRQVTPHGLKKLFDIIFHSTPLKVKGIQVVHLSFMVNALVKLAKSLLPSKIATLLITHNSSHSLYPYVAQKSLPQWLGGDRSEAEVFNVPIKQFCFKPEKLRWYQKVVQIANEENSKTITNNKH